MARLNEASAPADPVELCEYQFHVVYLRAGHLLTL